MIMPNNAFHGLLSFVRYDGEDHRFHPNSTSPCHDYGKTCHCSLPVGFREVDDSHDMFLDIWLAIVYNARQKGEGETESSLLLEKRLEPALEDIHS